MRFTSSGVSWRTSIASLACVLISTTGSTLSGAADLSAPGSVPPRAELHPSFDAIFARSDQPVKTWVFFRDKGHPQEAARKTALQKIEKTCLPRTIERRKQRGTRPTLFDEIDLPVAERYIKTVTETGAKLHIESRWLNAISVYATEKQVKLMARLPFVRSLEPVRKGRNRLPDPDPPVGLAGRDPFNKALGGFYGSAEDQLAQINLIALHNAGMTGQGVVIGILDTGFKLTHNAFNDPGHVLNVVAEKDFVNNDGNTANELGDDPSQHNHGTYILGTLGAYLPNQYVGAAYDASFILCKTEDVTQEVIAEEDNFVAGLEFIELNGGDVVTSSLGYIDWYTQSDLDGLTAITTIAVNIAISQGLICCNAAGNSGHDSDPTTSNLIAPADAFGVITCGAADSTGVIAGFSSDGPTWALSPQDRRIKPELLARGVSTQTVSPTNDANFVGVSGTSLSTPLIAGAVACLVQTHPSWTVSQMRNFLFQSADDFVVNGEADPLFIRGYGMVNAYRAALIPCPSDTDFSGMVNVTDLLQMLGNWGTCLAGPNGCPGDSDFSGEVNVTDLLTLLASWGGCP